MAENAHQSGPRSGDRRPRAGKTTTLWSLTTMKLETLSAARTRTGFTPALRGTVFKTLRPLEIATCPFSNLPEKTAGRWGQGLTAAEMKECRWLKPVTVGRFEFVDGLPRRFALHTAPPRRLTCPIVPISI